MIVLDACAVVEMVRRTQEGLALQRLMMTDELAISCDLVRAETASVLRKLARAQGLQPTQAERYLVEALALVDRFYPIEELQSEAFRESIRLDHSVYDMFYFVLARRTGATLFTVDRKLMDLCLRQDVPCLAMIDLQ